MNKFTSFFALIAVLAVSCAPKQVEPVFNTEAIDSLQELVNEHKVPVLQYKYLSPRDVRQGVVMCQDTCFIIDQPISDTSVFQAASLSKPLFAYIVMRMVDKGQIDLDTPLCNYTDIERFEDKESASKITARIVLSHQTGLPNWAAGPSSEEWPRSPISFKYPVDSCFAYSGEGYAFLQRAVEAIRGESLDEVAREEVFDVLGMKHSSYAWRAEYDSIALPGFNRAGENRGQGRHPRENSAYTLRTNASDYASFLSALMKGTGLSKEIHSQMFTPQVHAIRYADMHRDCDSTVFWCLGFGCVNEKYFWHWGDNGSFKAFWFMHPESSEILVYFTNSANAHDMIKQLFTKLTGEELPLHDWINN